MKTALCEKLGIEHPIFGFTPSPEVAAAITRAGGMGVLGAIRYTDPAEFEKALVYMDENCDGKPYGVDVVMPHVSVAAVDDDALEAMIDDRHRAFVAELMERFHVDELPPDKKAAGIVGWIHDNARAQVNVALSHNIALIANALGPPPADVIEAAHAKGVLVAALAGKAAHAAKHVAAGVDIIVAQGHEAGGHCGDVTTLVLVPEIVDAVGDTPVLAAGGIGCGRQVAASFALGAEGVWLGSLWLASTEYSSMAEVGEQLKVVQAKLVAAGSNDTVRSRVISGKPARMLKTAWTEAWVAEDSPGPLPMPLQGLLVADAEARIREHGTTELLGTPVGQIVGRMNAVVPVAEMMASLVSETDATLARLQKLSGK
ncbi:MAG: NAD(P)H-dependent flavin oxidoreductase YrpB (nitropropane dioxygenase family) [Bradymonadia bacterium]|jgi:NAD(P)H-dependent flavin oxidoreductase YrpB (nitropropane dioxygenase family)